MAVNGADPYELLAQLCILSDSQEELLHCCSFAGNPNSVADGAASSDSQFLRPHPSGVLLPSLPDRSEQTEQLSPNYAYQPPPEQSVGQQPTAADGPSLGDAVAMDGGAEVTVDGGCVCDVAMGVDLGKNPDLGFTLEVQPQQILTETEFEIEIIDGVRRQVISESESGREESASGMVNLSKEALGFSSAPIGEETGCINKKRKLADEKLGNSEETSYLDPWRRILNASKDRTEKELKENEGDESGNSLCTVLEILKLVGEKENEELDENLGNMNILEIVSGRGMTFPRPCWWPEGKDFEFK